MKEKMSVREMVQNIEIEKNSVSDIYNQLLCEQIGARVSRISGKAATDDQIQRIMEDIVSITESMEMDYRDNTSNLLDDLNDIKNMDDQEFFEFSIAFEIVIGTTIDDFCLKLIDRAQKALAEQNGYEM